MLFDRWLNSLIKHPWRWFLLACALLVPFVLASFNLKANFSTRIWHHKSSPEIIALNNYEATFGGDDIFYLGVSFKAKAFTDENLQFIQHITQEIWRLPDVLRVDSLANYNRIEFKDEDIEITPLVPQYFNSAQEIEKNADSIKEIQNLFISKNKKLVLFSIKLKPSYGKNTNYTPFIHAIQELIKKNPNPQIEDIYYLGSVAVANAFKDVTQKDNQRLMPVMFILIMLVLLLYFRSITGVLIPIIIVIFTILESFGFMALMGYEFNSVLGAIPGVLLSIGLADAVHVFSTYYQQRRNKQETDIALYVALKDNLMATFLTSATTAVSFFCIAITELIPLHDLGMTAVFGTLMAWVNTYLLIPSLVKIFPLKLSEPLFYQKLSFQHDLTSYVVKRRYAISAIFIVATSIATVLCFKNEANSDPLKYFDEDTKIKKDFAFAQKELGNLRTLNLVIDSGSTDGIKDPRFLHKVDSFLNEAEELPFISKTSSLLEIIKEINFKLNPQLENQNRIPTTSDEVAQLLFLYSMGSSPELGLNHLVSQDNRLLNLTFYWETDSTKDSNAKNRILQSLAKKWGLTSQTGGTFVVYADINEKVVGSFYTSILSDLVVIVVIFFIVFRSLFYALLALIPNLVPLILVGAYTAMTGIYIDVGASIVFTICLGIAVDDTIHFMSHYIAYRREGKDVNEALRLTYTGSGEAIILTTTILTIGFGSFAMADFIPNKNFGILSSMVLLIAVIAEIFFLPALLSIFSRQENSSKSS